MKHDFLFACKVMQVIVGLNYDFTLSLVLRHTEYLIVKVSERNINGWYLHLVLFI